MKSPPRNVYRRFVEFEEKAATIYLDLVSHFSQDPRLSSFWLDMAMQEKQHAGLLQFCLRNGLFASDLPDTAEIQKLAGFFKRLEKRATDPKLTAEEAFSLAIELEASENQRDLLLSDNDLAQFNVSAPKKDRHIDAQSRR